MSIEVFMQFMWFLAGSVLATVLKVWKMSAARGETLTGLGLLVLTRLDQRFLGGKLLSSTLRQGHTIVI